MHNHELPSIAPQRAPETDSHVCARRLDRRAFLRDTALAVAAALATTALAPGEAFAESVSAMSPISSAGMTRTYPIPQMDGVQVDLADSVVLARWQGMLYAFSLECPHRGATLRWNAGEQQFFCPKHKARFTPNGAHASGRATRALDRFAVKRTGGSVVIALDQVLEQVANASAWAAAPLKL